MKNTPRNIQLMSSEFCSIQIYGIMKFGETKITCSKICVLTKERIAEFTI